MAFPDPTKPGQSVIRNDPKHYTLKIVSTSTSTITMSDMRFQGATPVGAILRGAFWSSAAGNDHLEITRGTLGSSPIQLIYLHNNGCMNFEENNMELSQGRTLPINVVPSNSGHSFTVILCFEKMNY